MSRRAALGRNAESWQHVVHFRSHAVCTPLPSGNSPRNGSEPASSPKADFQGAERMLGTSAALPAGTIAVTALADANAAETTAGVVRSVEFHPGGQLLMTAGLDKRLRLFQVRVGQG